MNKTTKIIYWIATIWLGSAMLAGGLMQIMHYKGYVDLINHVGYPVYFLTIIGTWKVLGAIIVLLPGFRIAKEWAYAGFFFVMSGAVLSHLAIGDTFKEIYPSLSLLLLTVISWYFRPGNRKFALAHQ